MLGILLAASLFTATSVDAEETAPQRPSDIALSSMVGHLVRTEPVNRPVYAINPFIGEEDIIPMAQAEVRGLLTFPQGANFRSLLVSQYNTRLFVCGEVNTRNSLGQFSGFQRFISSGLAEGTMLENNTPAFGAVWGENCLNPLSHHPMIAAPIPAVVQQDAPAIAPEESTQVEDATAETAEEKTADEAAKTQNSIAKSAAKEADLPTADSDK